MILEDIMKKEKIILAFFFIPFFLFSSNLKYLRIQKDKKPNPYFLLQQIKPLNKAELSRPKSKIIIQDQVQSNLKPSPPKQYKGEKHGAVLSRKPEKKPLVSSEPFRVDRRRKHPPYRLYERIKQISRVRSFRLRGSRYAPDQVLVKFKSTLSEQKREAIFAAYQTKKLKRIPGLDIYKLQIPEGTSVEEMLYLFNQNPDMEYASPNYYRYHTITPNDTLFNEQYALYNSGQVVGPPGSPQGKNRADIKATAGWEETKGEKTVIIAVIDTGIDLEHPDLINKISPNGWDFVDGDSVPEYIYWWGTHVAGIAGAETNNGEGIAGVAWNCKIMPLKVFWIDPVDGQPTTDDSLIIEAIKYAADNGADVINMSFGDSADNPALEAALKYAYERDVVCVAAAGNDGEAVLFPAAYDDYCLAVAATDNNDERVTFLNSSDDPLGPWESNFGPEVDVAAPGLYIWSCDLVSEDPDFPYRLASGTSMAAPHVAGLAALIKSIKPHLTAAEIMSVIRYSADDINSSRYPGKDDYVGYGRLNMEKALAPIMLSSSKKQ
jgi:subtilisin family serine protease